MHQLVGSNVLLGVGHSAQGILSKPLHNSRHHLFESRGRVDADKTAFFRSMILEIMMHAARNQGVTPTRSIRSLPVNKETERTGQHIKDMVVRM